MKEEIYFKGGQAYQMANEIYEETKNGKTMVVLKNLFFKGLMFCVLFLNLNNVNAQVPYVFQEGFETSNPVVNWTASSGMLSGANTVYSLDNSTFSEGNKSLKLNVTIPGLADPTQSWYYYLKIPITPIPNLEDSLSFSIDIKMDSLTSLDVRIGLRLPYYPAASGLYRFSKITAYNQWYTIESDNLKELTNNGANNWVHQYIYDGQINDIGRALDHVGILIYGKGPKNYTFNIDNLNISGMHTDPDIFEQNYNSNWANYIQRVGDSIAVRQDLRDKFAPLPDTSGLTLCPSQLTRYALLGDYLHAIDSILNEMKIKNNANTYFSPVWMTDLDEYLIKYQHDFDFINYTIATNTGILTYNLPAMKYYRLQGYNTPQFDTVSSYNLRMTAGEYRSISTLILPVCSYGKTKIENSSFTGNNSSVPAENLDIYISKIWYQAGLNNTHKTGKFLTQELLLKNDSLVKVDYDLETNSLLVTHNSTNITEYINITDSYGTFPNTNTITFNDSDTLLPFKLDSIRHKLLWSIIHIPENTLPGNYSSTITIKDEFNSVLKEITVNIEVLPFDLAQSRLTYSLYYHGTLDYDADLVYTFKKRPKQKIIELKDMKEHGVLYPNSYDNLTYLDEVLDIRNKIGFPKDRFYSVGLRHFSPSADIISAQNKLANHGYNSDSLYVYGIDEADISQLPDEIDYIQNIHSLGARVFAAGYDYTYQYIGDYLDLINYAHGPIASGIDVQIENWHNSGAQIFAYNCPQVGVENPEIYRRNFGCLLWNKGFDGAMDYAYQKQYGAFWNDFDSSNDLPAYREETFTYPTTAGIVGTVQWEGYRAAITDVQYISTLLNLRDTLVASGYDVTDLNNWIDGIDCSSDLDVLREDIIDKILYYTQVSQLTLDTIYLNSGWNLISTDVIPEDSTIATVFGGLNAGNLIYISGYNNGASFYDPNGPVFLNTLNEITRGYGYWVKVNTSDTLVIEGTAIDPEYRVPLNANWNLIGYPPQDALAPEVYFEDLILSNNLVLVLGYNNGFTFFDPNSLSYTLTQLENSYGYWVKVNVATSANL